MWLKTSSVLEDWLLFYFSMEDNCKRKAFARQ